MFLRTLKSAWRADVLWQVLKTGQMDYSLHRCMRLDRFIVLLWQLGKRRKNIRLGVVLSCFIVFSGWTFLCSLKRKRPPSLCKADETCPFGSAVCEVYAVRQHVASLTGCKITAFFRAQRALRTNAATSKPYIVRGIWMLGWLEKSIFLCTWKLFRNHQNKRLWKQVENQRITYAIRQTDSHPYAYSLIYLSG